MHARLSGRSSDHTPNWHPGRLSAGFLPPALRQCDGRRVEGPLARHALLHGARGGRGGAGAAAPMPPPRPRLPPARGHHGPPLHVRPRLPPPPRRRPGISSRHDLHRVHLLLRSERRRQLRALSPWR